MTPDVVNNVLLFVVKSVVIKADVVVVVVNIKRCDTLRRARPVVTLLLIELPPLVYFFRRYAHNRRRIARPNLPGTQFVLVSNTKHEYEE